MLFKMSVLEGLQTSLSREIILKKRKAYEDALNHLDYVKIAQYQEDKYNKLVETPPLTKNKLRMRAIISSAQALLKVQEEFGCFDEYIWSYVGHKQVIHDYNSTQDVPAFDELLTKISKDLKERGFKFTGSTIIYSYLQVIGIYNDHELLCDFR